MPIEVNLGLTEPQEEFVFSLEKFPLFCAGFGAGKSQALVARSSVQALQFGPQGIFTPTYDLMRLVFFPRITAMLSDWKVPHKLNKTDKVLEIAGGFPIIFRTMDNPDAIVGFEIADALVDELDTLPHAHAEAAWNKIIGRCRYNKRGGGRNTAGVGTTPEGFRFVYQRWVKNAKPGYQIIRAHSQSNPNLSEDYLQGLRDSYPPALLRAYLAGEFVNMQMGAVYPDFDRVLNHTDDAVEPGVALHIGMDFNVNNCSAVVAKIGDDHCHVVAEHVKVRDTRQMIELLQDTYPTQHLSIYPDASGAHTKSSNASESDLALLRAAGFTVRARGSNPPVRDRVASLQGFIHNASGARRLRVNTLACPTVTDCLEQQAYDQAGSPDKKAGNDHTNDALGYLVHYRWPIARNTRGIIDYAKQELAALQEEQPEEQPAPQRKFRLVA